MGWQDAPIIEPARKSRWQDAPVTSGAPQPPAPPAEVYGPAESYGPPMPAEPSMADDAVRGLRLGTQDVGRGVAGLFGAPVDIAEMVLNAGAFGVDKLAQAFGGEMPHRFSGSIGGSGSIENLATEATQAALGGDAVIPWEQRTQGERVLGRGIELATEAGMGSGAMMNPSVRAALPRSLTAPMEAAGSNTRVLAGDVAAGMGSGALMQTAREEAPDWMQGPILDIITGLTGGLGGAKLLNTGERALQTARNVPSRYTAMPESVIPRDPVTKLPVMRDDYARASALLQDKAFDPATAADEITSYLQTAGSGAHPTPALITGDPGLISAERQLRVGDTAPDFIAADQAAMGAVSDRIKGTRPEGGNPEAPRPVAAQAIEGQRTAAQQELADAQLALEMQDKAMLDLGAGVGARRSLDQSSRDLDKIIVDETYLPDRSTKNALYDAAAADPNVVVRTENVRNYADEMLQRNLGLNPVLRDPKATAMAEAFTFPKGPAPEGTTLPSMEPPDAPVTRTLEEAMRDRQALSTAESEARAQGNFERADTARGLRSGINSDIRSAAESGVPGTEKLATADQFYRDEFAPTYREGAVSPDFFRGIDRDGNRNAMPPEATAGRFLVGGPLSRAAAADVSQIIARAPNPAAATAAATDYVLADAVRSGVVRNGKVSEQALTKFMAAREGMFSQIPEIGAQFQDLLTQTRRGNADASALTAALDKAAQNLNLTERQINAGALKLIAESEPRKAVQRVFAQPDSVAAMREATQAFAGDPAAAAGWKAAVSDWLTGQVSSASKAGVAKDDITVSLARVERIMRDNEKALAEVFSPDEMTMLRQAQARLEVLSKRGTQASSGSATAENLRGLRGVITALANPAGIVTMMTRGALMAGSVERRIKTVADQFPDADLAANQLILRAATDPRIMEHMLRFPTTDAQIYTWSAKLNEMLVFGEAGEAEQ